MDIMASAILKVSVLASGSVLLNGEAVSLDQLRERIEAQKAARPVIWYYREAAGGEPPPEALQVMKLVVENRLPISRIFRIMSIARACRIRATRIGMMWLQKSGK
jgi:hypothetical protein